MGMAPLAIYLEKSGLKVTGEDDGMSVEVRRTLEQAGVELADLPADCNLVAYSTAINPSHPAMVAASERQIRTVRRGELLAEMVRDRKLVAICGSHGKTTTTAMVITALINARFPAGYVLGGLFADPKIPPARYGGNEWVVAEIDESDGTISQFSPEIMVVVNLDWDHADHYRSPEELTETFAGLYARTKGATLVNHRCTLSHNLPAHVPDGTEPDRDPPLTFGEGGDYAGSIVQANGEGMTLALGGRFSEQQTRVRARGGFNATNALAALAAVAEMGVFLPKDPLATFPGVRRRQSVLFADGDLTVVEDYAHHPAEITALLTSMREQMAGVGRLVVVFQPHRYSRTAQFKAEFAVALATADRVHLLDVYPAGERLVDGGTTADLLAVCGKIKPAFPVTYHGDRDATLFHALSQDLEPGDRVVFVGAGNVDRKARAWLGLVEVERHAAPSWDSFVASVRPELPASTRLMREEPLATKTTLRVGGPARVYAEPSDLGDLRILLRAAQEYDVPVHFLGRGSNLIVTDEGVDGLVVSLANPQWAAFEPRDEGRVWVGAGLRLKNLCGLAAKAGLVGFEFLEGIPGNVGGALRMNAGAMGGWMFDVVEEVQLMTLAGEVVTMPKSEMHVAYRHCDELLHAVALGALLRPAASADTETVSRQIDVYRRKRQESQPREPSAGCIFKNPPDGSAGQLIDEAGLKGTRVGDAEVSTVHANFIINRGRASGADVLELIRRVRAGVFAAKGVKLEPEAQLFGRQWEDFL